jgi:hypothetical protein
MTTWTSKGINEKTLKELLSHPLLLDEECFIFYHQHPFGATGDIIVISTLSRIKMMAQFL